MLQEKVYMGTTATRGITDHRDIGATCLPFLSREQHSPPPYNHGVPRFSGPVTDSPTDSKRNNPTA